MELSLGELEQLVMLALLRLGEGAYGVTVRRELEGRAGRRVSLGTVYKSLERLESKGYVSTRIVEPTPSRGGRRKKTYQTTSLGLRALRQSMTFLERMSEGLEERWEAP